MSKIESSRWEMYYRQQGLVSLPQEDWLHEHGGVSAYKYMSFPPENSSNWVPVDVVDGRINFEKASRIPGPTIPPPYKIIDFTYFRVSVEIPEGTDINSLLVTINYVDDGARMYLFNEQNLDGIYLPTLEGKLGGRDVTADFTEHAVIGKNVIVIVQFDDCPVLNRLTGGIRITLNKKDIPISENPVTPLNQPRRFYWADRLHVTSTPNIAEGTVNGKPFTYESSENVELESTLQNYGSFPKAPYDIPNIMNIKNTKVTTNTLTFPDGVKDLIIVFASIGRKGIKVDVEFDHQIQEEWKVDCVLAGRTISGNEGNAIIKIPGKVTSVTFKYTVAESRVNFLFGYEDYIVSS